MCDGRTRTAPGSSLFHLRRQRDGMLSWHDYKTEESRDRWAAKYRARGDQVWIGTPSEIWAVPSNGSLTTTVPTRMRVTINA